MVSRDVPPGLIVLGAKAFCTVGSPGARTVRPAFAATDFRLPPPLRVHLQGNGVGVGASHAGRVTSTAIVQPDGGRSHFAHGDRVPTRHGAHASQGAGTRDLGSRHNPLAGRVSTIALASVSGVAFGLPKVIVRLRYRPDRCLPERTTC